MLVFRQSFFQHLAKTLGRFFVSAVGDDFHGKDGYVVAFRSKADPCDLHLADISEEGVAKTVFERVVRDKDIAACRRYRPERMGQSILHTRNDVAIRVKIRLILAVVTARRQTVHRADVKLIMHGSVYEHKLSDREIFVERPYKPEIEHSLNIKKIDEKLHGKSRPYLSYPGCCKIDGVFACLDLFYGNAGDVVFCDHPAEFGEDGYCFFRHGGDDPDPHIDLRDNYTPFRGFVQHCFGFLLIFAEIRFFAIILTHKLRFCVIFEVLFLLSFLMIAFARRKCYHFYMKFNLKRTLLCSLAFGWISLFWGSYDAIMQSIDYDVFGLDSVLHGVIIAADNILGLFLLPLFGRLSDKIDTPFGNRKPIIVVGTVIAALGFMGVCVFASLGKDYFLLFIICLLITLAAMAAYRSPALALVPDVNPDRFRSVANAVSNVISVIMTVVAMLYFYVFMMFDGYIAIGAAFSATTLVMMFIFCFTVHEKKFKADMLAESEFAAEQDRIDAEVRRLNSEIQDTYGEEAEKRIMSSKNHALDVQSFTEDSLLHLPSIDAALGHKYSAAARKAAHAEAKEEVRRQRKKLSLRDRAAFTRFCILAVVFCFYMTYNALTSNFVKYAEYILGFKQNEAIIPLILAQAAAMIAFPAASFLSGKIGRRNTMLIGFAVMIAAFSGSIAFSSPHPVLYILFMILGISFGLVMVNIYPFFLETSKNTSLGQDTGIFSMSMTVAMVVTPILSGALISATGGWFGGGENAGFRILFPYSIVFLVLAFILTLVIKNTRGKSSAAKKQEVLDFDK